MPDAGTYLAYLAAIALLMITPGPDMLFVLANAARGGPRAAAAAAAGVAAGEAVHMIAAALGLASALAASPILYEVIRWAGAAYMLWLGFASWRALWRSRRRASAAGGDGPADRRSPAGPGRDRGPLGAWAAFRRGMVTNVLNPKMLLFGVAFLPQFVDADRGAVAGQMIVLGLTFVAVQVAVDLVLGTAAGLLAARTRRRDGTPTRGGRGARALEGVSGAVFCGLGVHLLTV